jgi:hypothetical protein
MLCESDVGFPAVEDLIDLFSIRDAIIGPEEAKELMLLATPGSLQQVRT